MASRTVLLAAAVLLSGTVVLAAPQQPGPSDPRSTPPAPGVAQVPAYQPDLLVESIEFKNYTIETLPNGTRRVSFIPSLTYKNGGNAKSGEFRLTWEYWDYGANKWQWFRTPFFTNNLAPGQKWTEGGQPVDNFISSVPAGTNAWPKFRAKLDTLGQVTESNELNNEKTREATPITAGAVPVTPVIPKVK